MSNNWYSFVLGALITFFSLSSCVADREFDSATSSNGKTVSLILKVGVPLSSPPATSRAGTTRAQGHEPISGSDAENYVAFDEYDFVVQLFTADGKYLSEFVPEDAVTHEDSHTTYYTFMGSLPTTTADGKKIENIRVMVLANWQHFDGSDYSNFGTAGTATLDEISSNNTTLNFTISNSSANGSWQPKLNGDKSLIPMFGLSEEIPLPTAGKDHGIPPTMEYENPIMLMRALAKVEIIDDLPSGGPITGATLNRSYSAGRFIPDFKANRSWADEDTQITTPSLPSSLGTPVENLEFFKETKTIGGKERTVWSAYIPEMHLSSDLTGGLPRPKFVVTTAGNTGTFNFDRYFEYEQASGSNKLRSVLRNHIYRYTANKLKGSQVNVNLQVSPWVAEEEEAWDYQDNIILGEEGSLKWSWHGDEGYTDVKGHDDTEQAQLVMPAGTAVSALGTFTISAPKGAAWHAYLRPLSNIEDAFMFVDEAGHELESITPSGTIDGSPVTIRIRNRRSDVADENNTALLVVMVETFDHRWIEADIAPDGASNYTIIQNRTDIYDSGESNSQE